MENTESAAEARKDWAQSGGGMSFSGALVMLKDGEALQRLGWNGKDQFVVLMPALFLPPYSTQGTARKVNDRTAKWIGPDTPLDCQPYFALFNAQKKWQPGWVPSTGDLLAEDWVVVSVGYEVEPAPAE